MVNVEPALQVAFSRSIKHFRDAETQIQVKRAFMNEQSIPARNMTPKALGPETPLLARQEALFRVSRAINVYRDPAQLFVFSPLNSARS